jgi:hypothetical protein
MDYFSQRSITSPECYNYRAGTVVGVKITSEWLRDIDSQEVSDPPIAAVRSIHDKAQLVISGTQHVSGMDRCYQI